MTAPRVPLFTYRDAGPTAPALVLLHGFPLDHRMWDDVARELPSDLTVLAADLPGLGKATLGGFPEPSIEAAAAAVAHSLHDAGITSAVVAGLSMGGYVALALAERHPELVAGLALVDTKSTADDDAARANRLRVAGEVERAGTVDAVRGMRSSLLGETSRVARAELVDRLDGWIGEQSPAGVAWSQRAMAARGDRTAVLRSFAGPATVVVGEEDTLTPVAAAEHMVAALSEPGFVVVPGAGHMSAIECPVDVARALTDLVHRVPPTY
ncbi:Pimeloyl-ACP methyl ester carboxylesterase [Sanguibacter gelidistatuariae]|uniref:Pimeloyl-ACP methyl ester carboxylesterase n=1 Tax=Sanguibacter gelidistatuariae TaxID=1814289 RepID=A0A1G6VI76_9MICO|nr:alpha/beta hydrolase [Sanguibacter gelidistatuariae]SDD52747.1 Pimeloyl-ACP methyl ester carboxylesterase [Sanguibacter gelidistatuariae]